ncbi:cytochrome o ubiquinol oxidase subunit IV [Dyella jejuensis]|uniref:Cytochrome bo(3) ubiquinol oxidase subunit 4 n=1 Tax=Dyella jejuensis TaxID=1432009 RepID=A0ABW8JCS3_9GAMM
MSSQHGHAQVAHKHDAHGSLKSYLLGFALSLILTFLSFGCVMSGAVPQHLVVPGIVLFCVVQLLVQLVFFLHMGTAPEQRENLTIGVFTILIIAIVVVGSLWVLHNMNVNMMHPLPLSGAD